MTTDTPLDLELSTDAPYLVRRVSRIAATTNNRKDVAAEKHFHDPNAATGEICSQYVPIKACTHR